MLFEKWNFVQSVVGSERALAKTLSHLEFVVNTNADELPIWVSIRVPENLSELSISRTMGGTVWLKKPLLSAS